MHDLKRNVWFFGEDRVPKVSVDWSVFEGYQAPEEQHLVLENGKLVLKSLVNLKVVDHG